MASISETGPSEWRGFGVTGVGVRYDAQWGVAPSVRSDGTTVDLVGAAIDATEGMHTIGAATLSRLELTGTGTRGAAGDGALRVDLGRPIPEERRVVLVEEQGQYTWVAPEPGVDFVEIPIEAAPGSRGLPSPIRRVIRFVAIKTAGLVVRHATRTLVGAWDEQRHPHRLRSWTPDDHRDPDAPAPDFDLLARGPGLLVVHGFTGSIDRSFRFESDVVRGIHGAYGGRTIAFDHPTLAVSPRANAEWLLEQLPAGLTFDVLAHSRGGLVARELTRLANRRGITVRSITFVATPNDGTPLADPARPMGLIDAVTNLVGAIPGSDTLQLALELLKDVVVKSALEGLTGLVAMKPEGDYITELNAAAAPGVAVRAISAEYEPHMAAGIVKTAQDRLTDAYFGGLRNDRIVPTLSTIVTSGAFRIPPGQRLVLDSSRGVDHSTFWTNERAVRQLLDWLRSDWPERPPAVVPASETEPRAEVALPPDPLTIGDVAKVVRDLPGVGRKAIEQLVGGPVNPDATPPTGTRPAVVVIPGIMGTHLRRKVTGQLIWVDPVRLARGHFGDLTLPPPLGDDGEVVPAGLNRTYVPLIAQLAASWDVYLAPFDWRADIRQSALLLAAMLRGILDTGNRPVHLVAHSMGGLVARSLGVVAKDVWDELADKRRGNSGRLVMLGTPNGGSFAVPLILSGSEMILKSLALVDQRNNKKDLVQVVASFPGIYQMLPYAAPDDDDHGRLFTADAWGDGSPVRAELLAQAEEFHRQLEGVSTPPA